MKGGSGKNKKIWNPSTFQDEQILLQQVPERTCKRAAFPPPHLLFENFKIKRLLHNIRISQNLLSTHTNFILAANAEMLKEQTPE